LLAVAGASEGPKDNKDKPKGDDDKSLAAQVEALRKEFQQQRKDVLEQARNAKTPEERNKFYTQYSGLNQKFAKRFMELARKAPKDPAAAGALVEVFQNGRGSAEAREALALLAKHHTASPGVLPLVPMLGSSPEPAAGALLKGILDNAKGRDDKGRATFALAQHLKARRDLVRQLKAAAPGLRERAETYFGKDAVKQLLADDPAKLEKQSEEAYERVTKDFADVKPPFGNGTLGASAEGALFELRHLTVGKPAPEIAGEDLDGKKFKLSDYKGKVVLLDFWGNW
jgi:hypothetical protein